MESIRKVLMERDGITAEEANAKIEEAKEVLLEHLENDDMEAAYGVCQECFGLEPDYLMELM